MWLFHKRATSTGVAAEPAAARSGAAGESAAPAPIRSGRPTVVVIDDDVAVDESFGQMLAAAGYDTHTEASRQAGLAYLESALPSVVILDLHLPDGTGLECLRRLRQWPQHRDLPVAILTGDYFLDEEVARELGVLGAKVFFKPVWEEDLLRIVEQLMMRRKDPGPLPAGAAT